MVTRRHDAMTVEDFLALDREKLDQKYEFRNGQIKIPSLNCPWIGKGRERMSIACGSSGGQRTSTCDKYTQINRYLPRGTI